MSNNPSPMDADPRLSAAPLEQRIIPVAGIRAESGDNPNLSQVEVDALLEASDGEIADALAEVWPMVEDAFYSVHDELQAATVALLVHRYREREGL